MSKVNRIVATRSFENAVKQLKKKHESKTLQELKQTVLELANYNITKQKSNHPLKNSDGHIDLHLKGGKLVLLYKYEDDVLTVSLRLQDVVNHDQLMSYDNKKYKAPAREYNTDNISNSTILGSYDEFMNWYDELSDEDQWEVDDIADTNGIPFYEEASDDQLSWLHDQFAILDENNRKQSEVKADYNDRNLRSLEDEWLTPPEYDDPIEHEDSEELVEVELNQVITVDVDGDYEWDDDTYVWASPDRSNEEWRSEDGVYIDDKVGVVEHIDDLIIPNVPTRPGKYRVTGLAELIYDVSGIQEYRTNYGPDDYESDLDTDHAVVSFNFRKSSVENLKITPVRR